MIVMRTISYTKLACIALKRSNATPRFFTYKSVPLLHNASITKLDGRPKREDISHILHHETVFSKWKVLIGENDWRDYSMGKAGSERYRTQNLPNCTFCPGIYELGIGIITSLERRDCHCGYRNHRVFNPSLVMPIYLGRTDNVRTRLQQYGRDGSHLEKATSHGIFSQIFSKGFPIVYRCLLTMSFEDAEKLEDQFLGTFDYALNEKKNCKRRPDDILRRLHRCYNS